MTLELIEKYQRPVVRLNKFHNIYAMIDTGAVYPVWMSGEERLQRLGAVKKKDSVPFGGLGGMTRGALYEIPALPLVFLCRPVIAVSRAGICMGWMA